MTNRRTLDERITAAKEEVAQKEARVKALLQQQKTQERKDRTHRFCVRGGKLEKLLPALAVLTEEQFETFVQKTLLTGFAEKVLRGLVPQEPADEPAAKTAVSAHDVGADSKAQTSASARVAG